MKKHRLLVVALALAVVAGWTAGALAADAAAPAAKAEKPGPAAKHAGKPKVEVKCEVTGKLDAKTIKNKKGKEVRMLTLVVAEAKSADGKPMDKLKGKTVNVTHKKGVDLKSHVGKDVTIAGTLVNHKRLVPDTIK